MSEELPYVCTCGVKFTNRDMFYDYFKRINVEPTDDDERKYEIAREVYKALQESGDKAKADDRRIRTLEVERSKSKRAVINKQARDNRLRTKLKEGADE